MQKTYCDRCNKEIDQEEAFKIAQLNEGYATGKMVGSYFGQVHRWESAARKDEYWSPRVDLCLDCRKELDSAVTDFMNSK